jgi:hypothetical protein
LAISLADMETKTCFSMPQCLGDIEARKTPMWPNEPSSDTDSAEEEIVEHFPLPLSLPSKAL